MPINLNIYNRTYVQYNVNLLTLLSESELQGTKQCEENDRKAQCKFQILHI